MSFKSHIVSALRPIETGRGEIFLPHLFLTYCFMNLVLSISWRLLPWTTFVELFGWYIEYNIGDYILYAAIASFTARVLIYNRRNV